LILYTSDDARTLEKVAENSKTVKANDAEDTIISLNTNYGIANFKKLMEEVLLPILQRKSNILLDSLRIQEITNILGVRTAAITSSFNLSDLNNPVAKDKAQNLIKTFNDLDVSDDTKNLIKNSKNELLAWRDLFYVYNLLINNERYGNQRLTPLFEDYMKEKASLGYNYVMFSSRIDSGKLNLFDLQRELDNTHEYIVAKRDGDNKTMTDLEAKVRRELENDILFYSLHTRGELAIRNDADGEVNLKVSNGDFVVVTSLTETAATKKMWSELDEVIRLIKSRGFIIKFEC